MLLVKEELQVKKRKGINVRLEVDLNLNTFFIEKQELKKSIQNSRSTQSKKILVGVMI
mgnify:CR=1 FL=1